MLKKNLPRLNKNMTDKPTISQDCFFIPANGLKAETVEIVVRSNGSYYLFSDGVLTELIPKV